MLPASPSRPGMKLTRCGTNDPHLQTLVDVTERGKPEPSRMIPCTCQPPRRVRRQAARRQISPAWTERQFVAAADSGAMALVVARRSFVGVQIPRERSVVRFDLAGAIVDALRDLIVPEEEHPGGVALFNPERQAVEARPSRIRRVEDRRLECRIRHTRHDWR